MQAAREAEQYCTRAATLFREIAVTFTLFNAFDETINRGIAARFYESLSFLELALYVSIRVTALTTIERDRETDHRIKYLEYKIVPEICILINCLAHLFGERVSI